MAEFAKMYQNYYGLKRKPITTRNPQSNAIIEWIHQTIGNIINTFDVSNIFNNDPWSGILSATMFAVRATYRTTLQESPMQLVFGWNSILLSSMLPTGDTFDKANKNELIVITSEKICAVINTNTRLVTKL